MKRVAQGSRAAGKRPYVMPVGGSTPLGAVGYANAAMELCEQMDDFDTIVLATGSGGTQAGLLGGLALEGSEARVLGFSVGAPLERQRGKVLDILPGLAELLGVEVPKDAVIVDDQSVGPGYGVPTPEVKEALAMAASLEGLYLDPVYTGKSMAGLIRHARAGRGLHGRPEMGAGRGGVQHGDRRAALGQPVGHVGADAPRSDHEGVGAGLRGHRAGAATCSAAGSGAGRA